MKIKLKLLTMRFLRERIGMKVNEDGSERGIAFNRWQSSGCPWLPSVGCQFKEPDSEVSSPGEVEDSTRHGRSSNLSENLSQA